MSRQQIVALTAAIDSMTKSFAKNRFPVKPKEDGKPEKGKGKSGKQGEKGYAEWKTTLPKNGEPQEKTVKGRNYFWCPNHGKAGLWVAHKPAECKLKDERQDGGKGGEKKKDERQGSGKPSLQPSAKLTATMTAIKKVSWADASASSDEDSDF